MASHSAPRPSGDRFGVAGYAARSPSAAKRFVEEVDVANRALQPRDPLEIRVQRPLSGASAAVWRNAMFGVVQIMPFDVITS